MAGSLHRVTSGHGGAAGLPPDPRRTARPRRQPNRPTATVTPIDLAGRLSSATTDDLLDLARSVAEHARTHDAIVIIHGTDTLEETAFLLALTHHCNIPVTLTGAQKPIDHREADGPATLTTALIWSVLGHPEVTVAFSGEIWPAVGIRKLHTTAETNPGIATNRRASCRARSGS